MERNIIGYYIKVMVPRERFTEGRTFRFKTERGYQLGLKRINRMNQDKIYVWLSGPSYEPIKLDYSQIEDVEVDGIDTRDYPDFVDAFISSATYMGRDMTDSELDVLNDDGDYVYQKVQDQLY